jgi:N,N'-diacetyllegionaminate synthase
MVIRTDSGGIRAGDRIIGTDRPTFIAAEIGINHNGDLDLACAMIDAAARAGADGVKFQNYRTTDFVSDRSLLYEYERDGVRHTISQFELFRRSELDARGLRRLADHCRRAGVVFFSTPTSEDGLRNLSNIGAQLVKNGSDYLTNLPLIAAMGRMGLPTILSTGMSTESEVDDAVECFRDAGGHELILLHCTSSYPTPDDEVNLRRIPALAARYQCAVGFSDHTHGVAAATMAVGLGAVFIEKHFTIDKTLPGPDQAFSSDEHELRDLVHSVRRAERQLGQPTIAPTASEAAGRSSFRLSCVAAEDLAAAHCLTAEDIAFRRPGDGLPPKQAPLLVGRTLRSPLARGERITLEHFV